MKLSSLLSIGWLILPLAVQPITAQTQFPSPSPAFALPPDAQANFEWFKTLGFPDVQGCPLVRVATGATTPTRRGPTNRYVEAFLLSHDEHGSFEVLATDLSQGSLFEYNPYLRVNFVERFQATPSGTPEEKRVGYEEVSLYKAADALVAAVEPSIKSPVTNAYATEVLQEKQAKLLLWSWACWRHGLEPQTARLYQAASVAMLGKADQPLPLTAQPLRQVESPKKGSSATLFRHELEESFGRVLTEEANRTFTNLAVSRTQLAEIFAHIAQTCPASQGQYAGYARAMADMLRQMALEDETHIRPSDVDLAALPPDQRAAELVYRLRDQTDEWMLATNAWRPESPVAQLWALPTSTITFALFAAHSDQRLSRSVYEGYLWSSSTACVKPVTVSELARQLLKRLAVRPADVSLAY